MRMLEIWRMKPTPRKVCSVGEWLFNLYLEEKKRSLKNDLGTDWFGRMMASLFTHNDPNTWPAFDFIDQTGANRNRNSKGDINANIFNSTNNYDCGSIIAVGTSSVAPGKTDYKLGSEVARENASASYTDGADFFTVSATFTLDTSTDIWEVGLFWKDGQSAYVWLLDRTVLDTAVTFPAGTPMNVTYKFAI